MNYQGRPLAANCYDIDGGMAIIMVLVKGFILLTGDVIGG